MNTRNVQPKIYTTDQCFRYIPRHSCETFIEEVELTQGQLLNYLPKKQYQLNKRFQSTKRTLVITFWTVNILFISFCQRITILKKILRNNWGMFLFKMAYVSGMYYFYEEIQKNAIQEQLFRVYTSIEDDYRKYKNTGDILLMNPNVKIFEDLDKISFPYYQELKRQAENKSNNLV